MSKQKNFLRLLAMCVTVIIVLACFLTIFVACGENDNNTPDNGGPSDSGGLLSGYDTEGLEAFKDTFTACAGYAAANYEYSECIFVIDKDLSDYGNYLDGEICYAYVYSADYNHLNEDIDYIMYLDMEILLFDSTENATLAVESQSQDYPDEIIQIDRIVICGIDEEAYDDIKDSSFPAALFSDEEAEFINGAFENATMANKSYCELEICFEIYNDYNSITGMCNQIWLISSDSNCDETYISMTEELYDYEPDYDISYYDTHRDEFTDDSYLRLENGIYYHYSKNKTGCTFKENGTGYTLTRYYYEGDSVKELTIPSEYKGKPVTEIAGLGAASKSAFYDCVFLRSVTIPSTITKIGNNAFSDCNSLTSIVIPNSVAIIEYDAFWGCSSLQTIYCEAESKPDGWFNDWAETWLGNDLGYGTHNVVWGYNGQD